MGLFDAELIGFSPISMSTVIFFSNSCSFLFRVPPVAVFPLLTDSIAFTFLRVVKILSVFLEIYYRCFMSDFERDGSHVESLDFTFIL